MPKHKERLPEFEAPKKKLITEHEQHVKMLYQKQINVATTLQSELLKETCFERRTEVSTTSLVSGTVSLKQLQANEEEQYEINKFLNCGLTTKDIQIYQKFREHGLDYVQKQHMHHEPELLKTKITSIIEVITKSTEDKLENDTNDIHNTNIIKSFLLTHPMNDIKNLESSFNEKIDTSSNELNVVQIRHKARKEANRLKKKSNITTCNITNSSNKTKWDKTEITQPVEVQPVITIQKHAYTCAKQNFYTIKNGEIVKIQEVKETRPVSIEITGRLTLEEIKRLPQFTNYETGKPSNVIYVKNLPKKTSEYDLKLIFKDYPAEEYKIMNGKMRGQAFLTFNSEETARQVLDSLNGVLINGKPVVLQYGRRSNVTIS